MLLPFLVNLVNVIPGRKRNTLLDSPWKSPWGRLCSYTLEAMLCQFLVPWLGWQSIQNPDDLQIKTKLWNLKVGDCM